MPVIELDQNPEGNAEELIAALFTEWRDEAGGPEAPVIYISRAKQLGLQAVRLYVAWDRWASLDQQTRSEIIMAACEEVDPELAVQVTIAMGLTREEAEQMKLNLPASR